MSKLRHSHVVTLLDFAHRELTDMPTRVRLPGMSRDLTEAERQALAYYRASLSLLNQQGAIRPEFLKEEPVTTEIVDSASIHEE